MERKSSSWYRLDNAAKIFPPNSNGPDTKVFRFACRFKEEADPKVLNAAVNKTLEEMPSFKFVLRQGLFWYYFDESDAPIEISQEKGAPCPPLYFDAKSRLFRVNYFHNGINLEVYHALTDGVGAKSFFEALVNNYLFLKHKDELPKGYELPNNAGSYSQQRTDSFDKYYSGKIKNKKFPKGREAYQLEGPTLKFYDFAVIEGYVPLSEIIPVAREYQCSLTELLCAVMMLSIRKTQKVRHKNLPVVVSVPVNLRSFFPSDSMRNFFSVFNVGYELDNEDMDLKSVAQSIHSIIKNGLNKDYLQARLDYLEYLETRIYSKLTPLIIKKPILRAAYKQSEKEYTTTISNVGKFNIEPLLQDYIDNFSVFNSTRDLQICVGSFKDIMCINFTSRLVSTDIEMEFFRILASLGIKVKIHSNRWEEE